ncbi:uncharacterized protein [Drosophila bipectinata]|uniref:uncharacterized protein n=1 Tax=Drosophila bipectinata TaxID=42026 RepID=UPI001C88F3E3|nr:uncharacterized protein LOC108120033 [Drosophila bipectinata]
MSNKRQNEVPVENMADDTSLGSISDDEKARGDPNVFLSYLRQANEYLEQRVKTLEAQRDRMLAQKLNLMSQITMHQVSETTILTSVLKLLDELNHRLLNEFQKTERLEDDNHKKNRERCERLIEELRASQPGTSFDKYTIMPCSELEKVIEVMEHQLDGIRARKFVVNKEMLKVKKEFDKEYVNLRKDYDALSVVERQVIEIAENLQFEQALRNTKKPTKKN